MARYNALLMDHFLHPRGVGDLVNPTAEARAENQACGDQLQLQLRIAGGKVVDARFRAMGCTGAIAASSFLTEWLVGRTLEEAGAQTGETLAAAMGGLPAGKGHCAALAHEALATCLKSSPAYHPLVPRNQDDRSR